MYLHPLSLCTPGLIFDPSLNCLLSSSPAGCACGPSCKCTSDCSGSCCLCTCQGCDGSPCKCGDKCKCPRASECCPKCTKCSKFILNAASSSAMESLLRGRIPGGAIPVFQVLEKTPYRGSSHNKACLLSPYCTCDFSPSSSLPSPAGCACGPSCKCTSDCKGLCCPCICQGCDGSPCKCGDKCKCPKASECCPKCTKCSKFFFNTKYYRNLLNGKHQFMGLVSNMQCSTYVEETPCSYILHKLYICDLIILSPLSLSPADCACGPSCKCTSDCKGSCCPCICQGCDGSPCKCGDKCKCHKASECCPKCTTCSKSFFNTNSYRTRSCLKYASVLRMSRKPPDHTT